MNLALPLTDKNRSTLDPIEEMLLYPTTPIDRNKKSSIFCYHIPYIYNSTRNDYSMTLLNYLFGETNRSTGPIINRGGLTF